MITETQYKSLQGDKIPDLGECRIYIISLLQLVIVFAHPSTIVSDELAHWYPMNN